MNHKIAKTELDADRIGEDYRGKPHGRIQWKGTDVCMDVYCKCGHHSHFDTDFAYCVVCPKCETVYACNPHIELVELQERPTHGCVKTTELE